MSENQTIEVNVDKILHDKLGNKTKYVPRPLVKWLKRIIHQEEINAYLRLHKDEDGVDWLRSTIKYFDVTLKVNGLENLPADSTDRYTFVSNHPLGGIDGVALGVVLGNRFNDNIRYLLNDILMNLPGLRTLGVPINVTGAQNREISQRIDTVFKSDHNIIVFPAGLCSRLINGKIQDLPWKKMTVQKSIQNHRTIVPIHFSGQNSKKFYRIANISKALGLKVNLAMLFLADELYKNCHNTFEITIGKPIAWQHFDRSKTPQQWAQWLRQKVYELNLTPTNQTTSINT